ncbi:hydroxyphenylacetyl-CoA thioesterase PaaI [Noviherbaspirillum sp. Root189]|uniref:hydroxyphenylacetyl-CoA thioesterase PaaI n=1 Tax=Noviherbaspirillum sp. Root189 TaxID=1736487 RepID=UPI00070DBE9B|nr:phenylacetic acid degradation protein [Noviherbaspirillum sp. Root189]
MHEADQASPAQAVAVATSAAMYERDEATKSLGMQIVGIGPGYARLSMPIRRDMLNGHKTCHGGFIFALADSAFAFSCNSYNLNTVAAGCSIEYLAPGREGDVLTAEAVEQARSGKSGVYDVIVTNQNGERIALFRGKSHQIKGEVVEGLVQRQT